MQNAKLLAIFDETISQFLHIKFIIKIYLKNNSCSNIINFFID